VNRVTSLKVCVRVLAFGLLLGASSTAYADAVAISSISFSNLQFTPVTGTAVFTPTGATTRAQAMNSLGEIQNVVSTTVPLAQATAAVTFASATGMASTTTSGATLVSVGGCTCTASSFVLNIFTGTLVIVGGQGNVDVTLSGLISAIGQVSTDELGLFAHAESFFNISVNGVPVFSNDELLIEVEGPSRTGQFQLVPHELSRVITLPFDAVNTIGISFTTASAGVNANEIPEPASVVLLVPGLGFMIGLLKKKRKTS
jgi:hypothetical protein